MHLLMLKAKLHMARVTDARLDYSGSLTIDEDLMEAADILINEKVQVVDINNGERLETYAIPGPRGSGVICLNGAAARLVQPGDQVIIMTYVVVDDKEARNWEPTVVFLKEGNRIAETKKEEKQC